jgi:hypothetical protein
VAGGTSGRASSIRRLTRNRTGHLLRIVLVVGPPLAGLVTWRICLELSRREAERHGGAPHGPVRLRCNAASGFEEVAPEEEDAATPD